MTISPQFYIRFTSTYTLKTDVNLLFTTSTPSCGRPDSNTNTPKVTPHPTLIRSSLPRHDRSTSRPPAADAKTTTSLSIVHLNALVHVPRVHSHGAATYVRTHAFGRSTGDEETPSSKRRWEGSTCQGMTTNVFFCIAYKRTLTCFQ